MDLCYVFCLYYLFIQLYIKLNMLLKSDQEILRYKQLLKITSIIYNSDSQLLKRGIQLCPENTSVVLQKVFRPDFMF